MELTIEQLRQLYQTAVKPTGHPDPVGFMARILLTSEGDPDYLDIEGRQGLIPLHPDVAMESVGSIDVQSVEGNVATALALDVRHMQAFGNIEDMIIATHDGPDAKTPSPETKAMLDDLDDARLETHALLFPPLATVEDVIRLLKDSEVAKPTKTRMNFFKGLLNGQ